MSTSLFLPNHVTHYIQEHSLREPAILAELRDYTASHTDLIQMQISAEQGQLIQFLIEILDARKTLEVGTFTGYSALAVALALPVNGQVVTCDLNEEWTNIAKSFWQKAGMIEKIQLCLGPALITLKQFIHEGQQNSFDFAFIDADKLAYDEYYELCLQLVRPGGLIMLDNVFLQGRVTDPQNQEEAPVAMRKLNDKIQQDSRVSLSMIPMSDGITLIRKR